MDTSSRAFRSPDSYAAEAKTRAMIEPFLKARGFVELHDDRPRHGKVQSQTIRGRTPSGEPVALRIRLCWRKDRSERARGYSAAQIIPTVEAGKWVEALDDLVRRHIKEGITHLLLVQREDLEISMAACVPIRELVPVWQKQRDESERLVTNGLAGRRKKNQAENGTSPTLWLQDDQAPTVPHLLWTHPGVSDLAKLAARPLEPETFTLGEIVAVTTFSEGSKIEVTAQVRQRSDRLRDLARAHFARQSPDGRLHCAVCNWAPPANLELSGPIVEIHHGIGIGSYPVDGKRLTFDEAIRHLAPLCPNCHRVLHAKPAGGAYSLAEFRAACASAEAEPSTA